MDAVIDRLEGEIAVLLFGEEEIRVDLPLNLLPSGVQEGDWLKVTFEPDPARSKEQREKINRLLEKLKNRDEQ